MKILITGISGYIGSLLYEKLLKESHINEIIGIDIKPPYRESRKLNFIKADIRKPEIRKYFKGCQVIYHLAFILEPLYKKNIIYDINLKGTKNVLECCKKYEVPKIIVASSVAAYGILPDEFLPVTENTPLLGGAISYYAHTKRLVEGYIDEYEKNNQETTVIRLRPSIVAGNNNRIFLKELEASPFIIDFTDRDAIYPFVHDRDCVTGFYNAINLEKSGKYIISLPEGVRAGKLGALLNKKVMKLPFPLAMVLSEFLFKLGVTKFSSDWVALLRTKWKFDISRAKKDLDWKPDYSVEDIFRRLKA